MTLLVAAAAAGLVLAAAQHPAAEPPLPPRSPPEHFHPCVPALRHHCADATTTSHQRCLELLPADANCTERHVVRFRAENCAQYAKYGGLVDIQLAFGAVADGDQTSPTDNAHAIRRAVNATRTCGGTVAFPTGHYLVNSTIELAYDSEFGPGASFRGIGIPIFKGTQRYENVDYNTGPTALIFSRKPTGPVIRIGQMNVSGGANDGGSYGCGGNVFLQNLGVSGYESAIHIVNSAWVRFRNVGAKAAVWTGSVHNAAMIVENSFWQWFEEGSSFAFRCDGKSDCRALPSVVLRGNNDTVAFVRTVYAIRFDRVTMSGGGVRYEQAGGNCGGIGWWDFYTVALEDAATPLIDIWVDPDTQVLPNGKRLPCTFPGFREFVSSFSVSCGATQAVK